MTPFSNANYSVPILHIKFIVIPLGTEESNTFIEIASALKFRTQ